MTRPATMQPGTSRQSLPEFRIGLKQTQAIMAIAFHLTLQHDGLELPMEDVCLMLLWITGRYRKGRVQTGPDRRPFGPPDMQGLGAYSAKFRVTLT